MLCIMIAFLLPSQRLKGSDRMLYDLVSSAFWASHFFPVVLIEDKKKTWTTTSGTYSAVTSLVTCLPSQKKTSCPYT